MEVLNDQENGGPNFRTHEHRIFNSIKLKKETVIVNYTKITLKEKLDEQGNVVGEERNRDVVNRELTNAPHPDLLKALSMLRKTVIQVMEFNDFKEFRQYRVIGISVNGEQDNAKAIITYAKTPKWSDDEATANTVPIPLFDNDDFGDSEKVDKMCTKIKEEAFYFVDGVKEGMKEQLELQFEGGDKVKMDVQQDNTAKEETPASSEEHHVDLPFGNEAETEKE